MTILSCMRPSKTHLAPVAWPRTDENEIGEPVHSNPSTGHQAGFRLVHLVHPLGSFASLELVHWSWRQTKRCRCGSVRDDAVLVCGMELFYQRRRHNTRKEETSTYVPAAGQQEARRPASSRATTSTLARVDHTHASTTNAHTHIHTHKHTDTHTRTPQPPRCSAECPRHPTEWIDAASSWPQQASTPY